MKAPWTNPTDAPIIEQSIHDYIVSIFRQLTGPERKVEIVPISPGAESTRGWDAAVMQAVPLYFQYKYPEFTSRPWATQEPAFARRRGWAFDDSDGLFHFALRAKAKKAAKSQHELLVDLCQLGSQVFYVAPTFIDAQRLRSGGDTIYGRPWIWSRIHFRHWRYLDYPVVPLLDGLICIPPGPKVSDPPESHSFFFNSRHEVSLHSDPEIVESKTLSEAIDEQLLRIHSGGALNSENVDAYISRAIEIVGGDSRHEQVAAFFESNLSRSPSASGNRLMRQLRGLAKMLRRLYGIEMMLTTSKD